MFLLFSKVVTLVYENCLGCFVALSLEFFDMITEDNDFIMKYDTYFFICNKQTGILKMKIKSK